MGAQAPSPYNLQSLLQAGMNVRENRHLEETVEGQIPALRRYARGLAGPDQATAADRMVAEVVARALREDQRSQASPPRLWLFAALTSQNRRRLRAPGALTTAMTPDQAPKRTLGLREALAETALECREALLLVVVEGFSYAQAAEILGVNRLGVATRLARGRQELSKKLGAKLGADPAKPGAHRPPYLRLVK